MVACNATTAWAHPPATVCTNETLISLFQERFLFENAVDPLGDGVLERIALLAHADADLEGASPGSMYSLL